jgi:hypothetical protein
VHDGARLEQTINRRVSKIFEPNVVISPLTGWKSLIATGRPSSGRGRLAFFFMYCFSACLACASARS